MSVNQRFLATFLTAIIALTGCSCEPTGASDITRFDHMEKTDLKINDTTIRAWIAKTDTERASGFMYVEPELLEPLEDGAHPGMVFVFTSNRDPYHGFWMRNVPVPLDIAFVKTDGTIITIRTMAAYDYDTTTATEPYRYTIEVKAGLFNQLGIETGDKVQLDESVLASAE